MSMAIFTAGIRVPFTGACVPPRVVWKIGGPCFSCSAAVEGEVVLDPKIRRMHPQRSLPRDTLAQGNDHSCDACSGTIGSGTYGSPSPGGNQCRSATTYRLTACSMYAHPFTKVCVLVGNGCSCLITQRSPVPLQSLPNTVPSGLVRSAFKSPSTITSDSWDRLTVSTMSSSMVKV